MSVLDFAKDLLYDLKYAQDEDGAELNDLRMGEVSTIPALPHGELGGVPNGQPCGSGLLSSSSIPWAA